MKRRCICVFVFRYELFINYKLLEFGETIIFHANIWPLWGVNCEYIEWAVVYNQRGLTFQGFSVKLITPHCKKHICSENHTESRNLIDNLLRKLRWAGHISTIEERKSGFKILTGKPTEKTPLGRPRRRWNDNIRMNLKEIGDNTRIWVDSAQDRGYWRAFVNAALNLRVL